MSPFEHGEVFVLDDGGEARAAAPRPAHAPRSAPDPRDGLHRQADLDLGNYERFVDVRLTRDHNITTGKIYQARPAAALEAPRFRAARCAAAGCPPLHPGSRAPCMVGPVLGRRGGSRPRPENPQPRRPCAERDRAGAAR